MSISRRIVIRGMVLVSTVGLSGCLFAAAAGAGGAIHFSGHTAEAIVERSVAARTRLQKQKGSRLAQPSSSRKLGGNDMALAVAETLAAEAIEVTASHNEDSGAKRSFEGTKGDLDVRVSLERDGMGTKVRVSAQRNAASWDDDYAAMLLAKIIA